MATQAPHKFKTISEYHQFMDLPKPQHPLVSVVKFEDIKRQPRNNAISIINSFYSIALKKTFNAKLKYGQQEYDFKEGILAFIAPNQVISVIPEEDTPLQHTGWLLLFHPDFLWNTALASKIKLYDFFGYHLHEALHLSEKEELMLVNIIESMNHEYHSNLDKFSQEVLSVQLELLLTYADRFYQRQFFTRKINNHTILMQLENLLAEYFKKDNLTLIGLPTVQYISDALHVSPNYLSRLLKTLSGQSTQHFIHDKLIACAKEKLSTTDLSVNEIAYTLGFEHPQSFSKLFKIKTNTTPLEFRQTFN
ncbi:helix-turn-helix domain-containing protein [Adhaeribacter pallidiroseus]|uniref:HTH araC/xylS-type domain-containing protein n=1 Tax=Adhaeribacter pallidiroseus TaxID=2072847 RepID=A0A369QHP4_9BACT|nr:response regulator transcription factor [Adhaeribacter pallidiroseus]RDC63820.1 hypothetical protein AHMF7616_02429 [Adhaeribacter pallidiroseus]